jgi:glutamate carboxypeptidase
MQQLSHLETAMLDTVDAAPMLPQVQAWSAVNTGTGNLTGLKVQAAILADAFSTLPGGVGLTDAAPITAVGADGLERELENGQHLMLRVRSDAPRRFLLTGHMDTVFSANHPFQSQQWLDADTLVGPGVGRFAGDCQ